MEDLPQLLFILALILINGFFAAAEIALVSVRRSRIRQLAEEGDARAERVQKLLEDNTRFLSTLQLFVTFVGLLASAVGAVSLAQPFAVILARVPVPIVAHNALAIAVFLVTLGVGFVTLVVGEIGPKSLAMQHAERIALSTGAFINFLSIIAHPAVAVVSFSANLLVRPLGGRVKYSVPVMTEEEIKILVEAGEEEGVLENDEKEMIHSIFEFGDTVVRQVMRPRIDMRCVDVDSTIHELLEVIMRYGHSRIPVFRDTVDTIVGIVHAKDLLPAISGPTAQEFDLKKLMRPPYFIPENKKIDELLTEFRRSKNQMAIVRDEYGGTAGLVTLEDLLEEIVGDIMDEYDIEENMMEVRGPDHAVVNARMDIEELNERLDIELPESDDYETLGGFVFSLFGRQPNEGESIESNGFIFTVESTENGRLQRISMHPKPKPSPEEADDEETPVAPPRQNGGSHANHNH